MEKATFKSYENKEEKLSEEERKNKIFVEGMLKRMHQEKYI